MSFWNVRLSISGPITIRKTMALNVEKGYIEPFQTTIKLSQASKGVWAEVVVKAITIEEANDAAVFFVGQMLDILCLRINLPLHVSLFDKNFRSFAALANRIVEEDEWLTAFRDSREYGINRPIYSRALSWHRKGTTSEDVIDKFIAFWSAIEGFGSESARRNDKTKCGSINQICDCFDQLWGEESQWKVIPNNSNWVNQFNKTRNGIAHGFIPVNVDTVREISSQLPKLQELVYVFLSEWEEHRPNIARS